MKIQDLHNAPLFAIKANANILEIAKVMKPTISRGNVFMAEKDIKFKSLSAAKIEMAILEKLRNESSPKVRKTTIGEVLIWDMYAIRIKANA